MPRKKKEPTAAPPPDAEQAELDAAHQTRKTRKRQAELPGVERNSDEVLDGLAATWVEKAGERAALGSVLKNLKSKIEQAMADRGIKRYRFVDGEIEKEIVISESKEVEIVKVKASRSDDDGDDE